MPQLNIFLSSCEDVLAQAVVQELNVNRSQEIAEVRVGIAEADSSANDVPGDKTKRCYVDPTNAQSIREASKGCQAAFVWRSHGQDEDFLVKYVDVLAKAGVQNVVVLTAAHASPESALELEEKLAAVKIPVCTFLRVPFFVRHFELYIRTILQEKILALPIGTEGNFAPLDDRDFAAVATHLLLTPSTNNPHNRKAYTLTGPKLYTGPQLAERLSVIINDQVTFSGTSLNEAEAFLQNIVDEEEIKVHLDVYRAIQHEELGVCTDDVQKILGEEKTPREVESYFGDTLVRLTNSDWTSRESKHEFSK